MHEIYIHPIGDAKISSSVNFQRQCPKNIKPYVMTTFKAQTIPKKKESAEELKPLNK